MKKSATFSVTAVVAILLLACSAYIALRTEQTYRIISNGEPARESPDEKTRYTPIPGVTPGAKAVRDAPPKQGPGQPAPYAGDLPSLAAINIRNAALTKVIDGMDRPWSMEFLADDRLLIAEATGRMRIHDLTTNTSQFISGVPEINYEKPQLGLMDIVLHPKFGTNRTLYFSYTIEDESNPEHFTTAVSRATLDGTALSDVQQILVALPGVKTTSNFGGALAFGGDGYLYVGTADRGINTPSKTPSDPNGKILRIDEDGEVPADNPFVDNPDYDPRVYATGIRNPQGLVYDATTQRLYETEHGPLGGDEINIIEAGKDYGWPTVSWGQKYKAQKIGVGGVLDGMEQPFYFYLPSIATSPIEIYRGDMFPEWEGDILVGALRGAHVSKISVVDGQVRSHQRILDEVKGRVRDIKVASDGSIYILVQTGGRLYHLYRDEKDVALEQHEDRSGWEVYHTICSSCHETGVEGTPQTTDREAWQALLAKGRDTLYRNAIDGINGMPPKGLCLNCSDEEVKAAVDTLIHKAGL